MAYNYTESMEQDIKNYIKENELMDEYPDTEELAEELEDTLWIEDSVTGNASGSYTFNRNLAKSYVLDNIDVCRSALEELCVDKKDIADHFLNEDWEWFDVTIRCYLLYGAIQNVVSELETA